jgi:hypothetical protein
MADEERLELPSEASETCCGACGHGADVAAGRVPAHIRGVPVQLDPHSVIAARVEYAGEERTIALTKPLSTVGRSAMADIVIASSKVSRIQCTIAQSNGKLIVTDGGSGCGTWVNGKTVRTAELCHGDRIWIGDANITFSFA